MDEMINICFRNIRFVYPYQLEEQTSFLVNIVMSLRKYVDDSRVLLINSV